MCEKKIKSLAMGILNLSNPKVTVVDSITKFFMAMIKNSYEYNI
jgi:hypothetical protein